MRLAKLTLAGFKSFADLTEFTFDHAVTGIVGPNGCGKSNVVDAIKWVLGERSSKSLRGTEMIDVIFAGSASRKPLGLASVKLTFENPILDLPVLAALREPDPVIDEESDESAPGARRPAAAEPSLDLPTSDTPGTPPKPGDAAPDLALTQRRRALPYDDDIVEIERRLYRDGESAYLINGKHARLKDIRELFLDTGVGADAYSIIEQGKVDAMLLASPQERRVIFEEAAGIAKYKQRRVEARRKLDRSQANLVSTREQLDSTERRLRLVRGQAAKARRFKELDEALVAWRLALAFEQHDELRARLAGLTSRQADATTQRDDAGHVLTEVESAKQESELARHDLAARHKAVEGERLTATHAEQQAAQRRAMLERAVEEARRQAGLDRARLADLVARHAATESALAEGREGFAALSERLSDAERRLADAANARAEVLEALNERRQGASQRQTAVARIDRERVGLLASIGADAKRADALRENLDRLAVKEENLAAEDVKLAEGVVIVGTAASDAARRAAELDALLKDLESDVGRLGADRRDRAESLAALEQERVRLDSRRATLQEMVQSRAGFAEAVRKVLDLKAAGTAFAGIIAPLADLIQTRDGLDPEAAGAVEAALGADLQGLVVESAATLPPREELASLPGRVAFLPMTALQPGIGLVPSVHSEATPALPGIGTDDPRGRVVSLRSLVLPRGGDAADPRLQDLLDRVLSRTYLVADLDTALLLAAGPLAGARARFITRDGVLVDADGRIHAGIGGRADDSTGILRRRAELESLTLAVASLGARVAADRDGLRTVDAEAAALSARAGEVRAALAVAGRSALQEQNKLERLHAETARIARERAGLAQEADGLRQRLAKLDEDRAGLQTRADSLGRLQEEESAAAAALDAEVRQVALRADAASEESTAAKVDVGRLSEQAASARRELARLDLARDELARHARDLAAQVDRLDGRLAEHAAAIDEAAALIDAARADAARLGALAAEAHAALRESELAASGFAERVHAARARFTALERDWNSLEIARRELEVKREALEERTQQELSLDLAVESADYAAMMAGGDVARIDTAEAALQIDTLRDAVKRLGHVNLDSLAEEQTLERQNDELVRQVADIDAACAQLGGLITRLDEVSRVRFADVFGKIQRNFGDPDGMFRKLFGGGKAEVRLMPLIKEDENPDGTTSRVETDRTDLLESGIEVVAKPPGKEPRSISQLSGGEKTLTAVALLMSIFRSKPSCFCVLDEVDAALDEGNVGRFNAVIREYTDRSHFIVITHNKRTMQSADRLYGVTMQERGVSTRVSVRFEDVGKGGAIKPAPAAEPPAAVPEPPAIEAPRPLSLRRALAAMREEPVASATN